MTSQLPGSTLLFDTWAKVVSRNLRRPVHAVSANKYKVIWNAWVSFLAPLGLPWHAARPSHLATFVSTRVPSSTRFNAVSDVTPARYWALITGIYEMAPVLCEAIDARLSYANPMLDALPPPCARREVSQSTVLLPVHLQALLDLARAPAVDDAPTDFRVPAWAALRDQLLLLIAVETGATVAELVKMEAQDFVGFSADERRRFVLGEPPDVSDSGQIENATVAQRPLLLHIRGSRLAQRRSMPVSAEGAAVVRQWLATRVTLPCVDDALFVSRKGMRAPTSMSVWRTLSAFVNKVLVAQGQQVYHHGPNLLRNAVLLNWLLQGVDAHEVARRAGVSGPSKLERLIDHADEETLARFKLALSVRPPNAQGALVDEDGLAQ